MGPPFSPSTKAFKTSSVGSRRESREEVTGMFGCAIRWMDDCARDRRARSRTRATTMARVIMPSPHERVRQRPIEDLDPRVAVVGEDAVEVTAQVAHRQPTLDLREGEGHRLARSLFH